MMLTSEAFNTLENATVNAMLFCVKLLDKMRILPIMPMWEKPTVTRWLCYRGCLPENDWNDDAPPGRLVAARCAADIHDAMDGFEPSRTEVPRTHGLDGGWTRTSQKGSEKAAINEDDK